MDSEVNEERLSSLLKPSPGVYQVSLAAREEFLSSGVEGNRVTIDFEVFARGVSPTTTLTRADLLAEGLRLEAVPTRTRELGPCSVGTTGAVFGVGQGLTITRGRGANSRGGTTPAALEFRVIRGCAFLGELAINSTLADSLVASFEASVLTAARLTVLVLAA